MLRPTCLIPQGVFRATVPYWGQTTWNLRYSWVYVQCGTTRVHLLEHWFLLNQPTRQTAVLPFPPTRASSSCRVSHLSNLRSFGAENSSSAGLGATYPCFVSAVDASGLGLSDSEMKQLFNKFKTAGSRGEIYLETWHRVFFFAKIIFVSCVSYY